MKIDLKTQIKQWYGRMNKFVLGGGGTERV